MALSSKNHPDEILHIIIFNLSINFQGIKFILFFIISK